MKKWKFTKFFNPKRLHSVQWYIIHYIYSDLMIFKQYEKTSNIQLNRKWNILPKLHWICSFVMLPFSLQVPLFPIGIFSSLFFLCRKNSHKIFYLHAIFVFRKNFNNFQSSNFLNFYLKYFFLERMKGKKKTLVHWTKARTLNNGLFTIYSALLGFIRLHSALFGSFVLRVDQRPCI